MCVSVERASADAGPSLSRCPLAVAQRQGKLACVSIVVTSCCRVCVAGALSGLLDWGHDRRGVVELKRKPV